MDRRASHRRPKPHRHSTTSDNSDEDYRGHRFRHVIPSRHPRKHRRITTTTTTTHHTPPPPPTTAFSDGATFSLLEAWGDRFLQLGRSSLRSSDWAEVAGRVGRTVPECRARMSFLKGKYRRERVKWGVLGGGNSKWVFYKKMDSLMTMSPRQLQQQEQCGLACGVDSGEFVFLNPGVYLEFSNAVDELRDSPGNSEDDSDDDNNNEVGSDGSDDDDDQEDGEESYRMLTESIRRVGEIYEKIEDSKREHMMELERMRVDFQRELEVHKEEMVVQTKAEIAKFNERGIGVGVGVGVGGGGGDQDSDCSVENLSE